MMDKIHEHSYLAHLLPERANILDLGCRGFYISNFFQGKHNVINVDVDDLAGVYIKKAITGHNGTALMRYVNGDPQATKIIKSGAGFNVECQTLDAFSEQIGIKFWDWIKADIEGSEYDVIMSLNNAPARQLGIEFHLHTGAYGENEVKQMVGKLTSLGYRIHSHEKYSAHGCGPNYWDSLFIL